MKDFNTYQTESRKTWGIIPMNHPIVYPIGKKEVKLEEMVITDNVNRRGSL